MVWLHKPTEDDQKLIDMTSEEFDQMICKKFPDIYRERKLGADKSCMAWGFCVGPGWHSLLYELSCKLARLQELTGHKIVALQIKEKFAGLRFYYKFENKESSMVVDFLGTGQAVQMDSPETIDMQLFDDIIQIVSEKSFYTCEECGQRGKGRSFGNWISTLCPLHSAKKKQELNVELEKDEEEALTKERGEVKVEIENGQVADSPAE